MPFVINSIKKQWFTLALLAVVVFGISLPQAAGLNEGNRITTVIVILVFLGIGFTLPSESLVSSLTKWKIHLFMQCYIFLFVPAVFCVSTLFFRESISTEIYIGLLALSVLPTTISTCSVFTQISGGDVMLALFNASLSNLIGVFLSPLLLSFILREVSGEMPFSVLIGIITGLAVKMVLPLFIGQVLRFVFLKSAENAKQAIGVASNLMILTIVFFTLAKSASTPLLGQNLKSMMLPVIYLVVIHSLLILVSVGLARSFKLTGAETIAVMYATPQKTLAMGVPLLTAFFADTPAILGIAILPLLFYHPWELLVSGLLKTLPVVKRWGRESNGTYRNRPFAKSWVISQPMRRAAYVESNYASEENNNRSKQVSNP